MRLPALMRILAGMETRRRGGARPRTAAMAVLTMALGAAVSGCGGDKAAALPPPPTVVEVAMVEHRFDYRRAIPPGRVIFRVANLGRVEHQMVLTRLPDDLLPLDDQLHSDVRRPLETLRTLPAYAPGESGSFAVNLAPGRYGFLCFLQEPGDEVSHALQGMNSEFLVG